MSLNRLAVTISTAVFVLALAGAALADHIPNTHIIQVPVSYGWGKLPKQDKTTGGWGFGAGYEYVMSNGKWSLGFNLSRLGFIEYEEGDALLNTFTKEADIWPFYLSGRYFFGSPKVMGYVSLGLGGYFADYESVESTGIEKASRNGPAVTWPLGVYWFPHPEVFFNFGYAGQWLKDSPFQDDVVHSVFVAMGVRLR